MMRRALWIPALLVFTATTAEGAAGPDTPSDSLTTACEYGTTLALLGNAAGAESVFIWMLGRSSGDARALNDLGNLALLKGQPELALSFYSRATAADSADAGIVLNQATALMVMGEQDAAAERAALGVRMAGGAKAAGRLLGLRYTGPESDASKGAASQAYLSKEELTALLGTAAGHIPAASVKPRQASSDSTAHNVAKDTKHAVWRSAGARAGDQDSAALVYWMH
jgi:hypothetical protein